MVKTCVGAQSYKEPSHYQTLRPQTFSTTQQHAAKRQDFMGGLESDICCSTSLKYLQTVAYAFFECVGGVAPWSAFFDSFSSPPKHLDPFQSVIWHQCSFPNCSCQVHLHIHSPHGYSRLTCGLGLDVDSCPLFVLSGDIEPCSTAEVSIAYINSITHERVNT